MSDSVLLALATLAGVILKAAFDHLTNRRDTLWRQLQLALARLDELDKRHDTLLMQNGELRAEIATLKSQLDTERRTNERLAAQIRRLEDENYILRKALHQHGFNIEMPQLPPREEP